MARRNKYPDDQSYQDWQQEKNRSYRNTGSQGLYNENFNRNDQYNAGNQSEYNDYDRVNYFPDNDENRNYNDRDYENTQYGTSGSYGYQGDAGYENDYNRKNMNQGYGNQGYGNQGGYKSDFEKHYYQQGGGHGNYADGYTANRNQPRNRYGGDTRNYGNANQGGFDRDWWDRTKDEVASWFGDDEAEHRRRRDRKTMGPGYRGKGPKGYQRSETRIREDVCDRLTEDEMIDASNVEVQVQGQEVILTGFVTTRDQKRRAEDIVESVSGVRNVENRIRVGQTQTESDTGTNTM